MRKKRFHLAWALLLVSYGCALVRPSGPSVPPRGRTPYEQVLGWNAALAEANLAIARAVLEATEQNTVPVPAANSILSAHSRIADASRQLTRILQAGQDGGGEPSGRARPLLEQIRSAANDLTGSRPSDIKSQAMVQLIQTKGESIDTLAEQITETLKTLGTFQ